MLKLSILNKRIGSGRDYYNVFSSDVTAYSSVSCYSMSQIRIAKTTVKKCNETVACLLQSKPTVFTMTYS